jgi:methylated-DNA-protein-cysteine methyltransferase related protein
MKKASRINAKSDRKLSATTAMVAVTRSDQKKSGTTTKPGFDRVFEQVYFWVQQIPPGQVATYGQISRLMHERLSAAGVGWALKATPQDARQIPWQRVVNSKGGISTGKVLIFSPDLQRHLLVAEGVAFSELGLIDLARYQWQPSLAQQESLRQQWETLQQKMTTNAG